MDCGPPFHPQWQKMVGGKKVNSKKFKQQGGDGQGNQGHDVSMPIQYYGQKLNRYYPAGSSELDPPNSAYGKTIATSHGVTINGNSQFVGPDLGPFNGSIGNSGIQTGGRKKKKSANKKMEKNKKSRSLKKKGGDRLRLTAPNLDQGPPFHPIWEKKVGGKRKKSKQTGGDGQGNQGHDVSMPIQYYGQKLNRYFPVGSSELNPPNSAYGKTIATSHGVTISGNNKFVGPDLGPFNGSIGISGIQTGGGKKNLKKNLLEKI